MGRSKGIDDFNFKSHKNVDSYKSIKNITGVDNTNQLNKPLSIERRFRPALNTKNFSTTSEYNYASLWARWRRGYELSVYAQQAYGGLNYSFKYFIANPNVGTFLPGLCFMYPTTKTDMRMYMVGIRPRDSFNFLDFGYAIDSVTLYNSTTYAVKLTNKFGAPVSFFKGEVLSNRFNSDGTQKQYGYNNYTVVNVGINGIPVTPTFLPIFNTLFLSFSPDNSWAVVDDNTLAVPASGPPLPGEYLTTEMRYGCTCPDYLAREGFNLYKSTTEKGYPITQTYNVTPGFYDAGALEDPRYLASKDMPGFVRDFGVIYLNQIYNIPSATEVSYSDPNVYFHQLKWCKHIYAAMWDLRLRFGQVSTTLPWLVQPNDEPLNEYYREMFEKKLAKEMDFFNRERDLRWWERQSPAKNDMPMHMMYSDMQNMMIKILNVGGSGVSSLQTNNFVMSTIEEFNPFAGGILPAGVYDGGTYASGMPVTQPINSINGGTYTSGVIDPFYVPFGTVNGGIY